MKRFWFEFDFEEAEYIPPGAKLGCGVTAYDQKDALSMLTTQLFRGNVLPRIERIVEDVDVSTLDPNHVRFNMASPATRGIWFPLGYL